MLPVGTSRLRSSTATWLPKVFVTSRISTAGIGFSRLTLAALQNVRVIILFLRPGFVTIWTAMAGNLAEGFPSGVAAGQSSSNFRPAPSSGGGSDCFSSSFSAGLTNLARRPPCGGPWRSQGILQKMLRTRQNGVDVNRLNFVAEKSLVIRHSRMANDRTLMAPLIEGSFHSAPAKAHWHS